jgi:formate hydrogenlyase subunit 4
MIHEVMILDYSGFDLGLILCTGMLKFAVFGALIVNLFIGIVPWEYAVPMFLAIQAGAAVITGGIESFTARFRMSHNAQFIFALTSVSLLIFFGALLILGRFS